MKVALKMSEDRIKQIAKEEAYWYIDDYPILDREAATEMLHKWLCKKVDEADPWKDTFDFEYILHDIFPQYYCFIDSSSEDDEYDEWIQCKQMIEDDETECYEFKILDHIKDTFFIQHF